MRVTPPQENLCGGGEIRRVQVLGHGALRQPGTNVITVTVARPGDVCGHERLPRVCAEPVMGNFTSQKYISCSARGERIESNVKRIPVNTDMKAFRLRPNMCCDCMRQMFAHRPDAVRDDLDIKRALEHSQVLPLLLEQYLK